MIDNYKKLCTRFYDIDHPSPPSEEFAFYCDTLSGVRGPILEPMCGSGRFLVPLLRHGCDIYGFDGSVDMLEACRNRLDGDERVQLATFESFNSPKTFQACIIPAGSFSLLADTISAQHALECIHRIMAPDGVCHIEVCERPGNGSSATEVTSRTVITEAGTALTMIQMATYDEEQGVETIYCHYLECTERFIVASESERYELRQYGRSDFAALAEASGFTVVNSIHNAFNGDNSIFTLMISKTAKPRS
jgi:SAM-dependent methyltransferase